MELLDILVQGALTFVHAAERRRRGKCAGALVRLRQRRLGLLVGKYDEDFSSSSVL